VADRERTAHCLRALACQRRRHKEVIVRITAKGAMRTASHRVGGCCGVAAGAILQDRIEGGAALQLTGDERCKMAIVQRSRIRWS